MTNDDRTVIRLPQADGRLPVGYRLQEFVIEGVQGEGGFSIVYRARDLQLQREVALKEYLPAALATRGANESVAPRSQRHQETFELGLRSFINEAQLLASFDHPALVKVYRFWEANGTAYMVMPLYNGPTLKAWLGENEPPSEAWLKRLLAPLLDALEVMHREQCFHRDIAPDNILLLDANTSASQPGADFKPVLLDFGAARRVIGNADHQLTVILKPGYAPIEQYGESTTLRQGPWTDVYAMCAVLYCAISGRVPAPSTTRLLEDALPRLVEIGRDRYTRQFLEAVDRGLTVRPEARTQSIGALRRELSVVTAPTSAPAPDGSIELSEQTVALPKSLATGPDRRVERPPSGWSLKIPLAVAAAALAGVLAFVWLLGGDAPATAPATPMAPANAPTTPPSVNEGSNTAQRDGAAEPPTAERFTVLGALRGLAAGADAGLVVQASAQPQSLVVERDRLRFSVKSSEAGYVYVFTGGTDKAHFYLLFPNGHDANNRIEAGRTLLLPRASWTVTAAGPPGINHLVVVVSRSPREFAGTGLRATGKDEIPEFDLVTAERIWQSSAAESPFIGSKACGIDMLCSNGYGATMLEIEERRR